MGAGLAQRHPEPGPALHVLPDGHRVLQHLLPADHRSDVEHAHGAALLHPRAHPRHRAARAAGARPLSHS